MLGRMVGERERCPRWPSPPWSPAHRLPFLLHWGKSSASLEEGLEARSPGRSVRRGAAFCLRARWESAQVPQC